MKDNKKAGVIVKSCLIPQGICINLFGTFWARDTSWIDRYVVNHERIHTAQMREMLFLPFYVVYILEWLLRLVRFRNLNKAYRNISFEREAYANGNDLGYLQSRSPYAWLRYL